MKYSKKPRHYASKPKRMKNKNHPGHRSSGRGNNVAIGDPFALLLGIIPWLKKVDRT